MTGQVRVGRVIYDNKGVRHDPVYPNFTNIVVLTKSSKYGSISPYVLTDDKGRIMENIWQFSKVYKNVPKTVSRYSRWDDTVIWDYPAEKHVDENDDLLPEYWNWRRKGMNCKYPIRYPVGYKNRKNCLYCIMKKDGKKLDYIEARKKIYLPVYTKLVKKQPQFLELKERLEKGENLLILDVDGPHQESLDYYKEKYNCSNDFIETDSVLVTKENMNIFLNDPKHSFGHGYCLGLALLKIKYTDPNPTAIPTPNIGANTKI
jgi:hypothetical protein